MPSTKDYTISLSKSNNAVDDGLLLDKGSKAQEEAKSIAFVHFNSAVRWIDEIDKELTPDTIRRLGKVVELSGPDPSVEPLMVYRSIIHYTSLWPVTDSRWDLLYRSICHTSTSAYALSEKVGHHPALEEIACLDQENIVNYWNLNHTALARFCDGLYKDGVLRNRSMVENNSPLPIDVGTKYLRDSVTAAIAMSAFERHTEPLKHPSLELITDVRIALHLKAQIGMAYTYYTDRSVCGLFDDKCFDPVVAFDHCYLFHSSEEDTKRARALCTSEPYLAYMFALHIDRYLHPLIEVALRGTEFYEKLNDYFLLRPKTYDEDDSWRRYRKAIISFTKNCPTKLSDTTKRQMSSVDVLAKYIESIHNTSVSWSSNYTASFTGGTIWSLRGLDAYVSCEGSTPLTDALQLIRLRSLEDLPTSEDPVEDTKQMSCVEVAKQYGHFLVFIDFVETADLYTYVTEVPNVNLFEAIDACLRRLASDSVEEKNEELLRVIAYIRTQMLSMDNGDLNDMQMASLVDFGKRVDTRPEISRLHSIQTLSRIDNGDYAGALRVRNVLDENKKSSSIQSSIGFNRVYITELT